VQGTCDGNPCHDFRDLDDQLSCILEVLTSLGAYYWIPISQVESIEFHEPTRSRDLIWRRTHLSVRDGPDGEVYLPVLYPGAAAEPDDLIRLGRQTDWRGGDAAPVRGVGQRTFLVGDTESDLLAAHAAGCPAIMVSGTPVSTLKKLPHAPRLTAPTLLAAAEFLINEPE
jgi:type VI secretion system protein ImpE